MFGRQALRRLWYQTDSPSGSWQGAGRSALRGARTRSTPSAALACGGVAPMASAASSGDAAQAAPDPVRHLRGKGVACQRGDLQTCVPVPAGLVPGSVAHAQRTAPPTQPRPPRPTLAGARSPPCRQPPCRVAVGQMTAVGDRAANFETCKRLAQVGRRPGSGPIAALAARAGSQPAQPATGAGAHMRTAAVRLLPSALAPTRACACRPAGGGGARLPHALPSRVLLIHRHQPQRREERHRPGQARGRGMHTADGCARRRRSAHQVSLARQAASRLRPPPHHFSVQHPVFPPYPAQHPCAEPARGGAARRPHHGELPPAGAVRGDGPRTPADCAPRQPACLLVPWPRTLTLTPAEPLHDARPPSGSESGLWLSLGGFHEAGPDPQRM